ncbi:MAG: hypothetical protein J0H98_07165 [Solirubrobacterales bacterium]|nr:hypothetical protein [Solirubrobacterales bacterium]
MALTTSSSDRNTDRPVTKLGEAIDQIHDHRMAGNEEGTFQFCASTVEINPHINTVMEGRMI